MKTKYGKITIVKGQGDYFACGRKFVGVVLSVCVTVSYRYYTINYFANSANIGHKKLSFINVYTMREIWLGEIRTYIAIYF